MSRLGLFVVLMMFGFSYGLSHYEVFRKLETVGKDRCKAGFVPLRALNCIKSCINEDDPSDKVDAIVLHRERFHFLCCTQTTYLNGETACEALECQENEVCLAQDEARNKKAEKKVKKKLAIFNQNAL